MRSFDKVVVFTTTTGKKVMVENLFKEGRLNKMEKDLGLKRLRSNNIDKFWEELATALESDKRLNDSK